MFYIILKHNCRVGCTNISRWILFSHCTLFPAASIYRVFHKDHILSAVRESLLVVHKASKNYTSTTHSFWGKCKRKSVMSHLVHGKGALLETWEISVHALYICLQEKVCSKWPPCMSRQACARRGMADWTWFNSVVSTKVKTAWRWATKLSVVSGVWCNFFRWPHEKKSNGVGSGDGQSNSPPPHPIKTSSLDIPYPTIYVQESWNVLVLHRAAAHF